MFGGLFGGVQYDILFFWIPAALVVLFFVSLFRYISARSKNRKAPGTFPPEEMKRRKIMLIVFSVIAGILAAIVIGVTALLFWAIAHM